MRPLEFILRAVVWIVAIALWTSLNKSDDVPVVPVWAGASTVLGAIVALAGVWLYSAGAAAQARVPRGKSDMPDALLIAGPYAYTRNPLYLGVAIVMVGLTFIYQMPLLSYLKLTVLFIAAHFAVVFLEEPRVRRQFGAAYEDYCRRVPRWIAGPRLRA